MPPEVYCMQSELIALDMQPGPGGAEFDVPRPAARATFSIWPDLRIADFSRLSNALPKGY